MLIAVFRVCYTLSCGIAAIHFVLGDPNQVDYGVGREHGVLSHFPAQPVQSAAPVCGALYCKCRSG
jgi:hypothetical protein